MAASKPHTAAGNRGLMVLVWLVPVVLAIGGGALIHFDLKRQQQARINAASTAVRDAVQGADDWIKQGRAKDGEDVEHRLTEAMGAKDVSEKAIAVAALERVRTRRAEQAADAILDSAKAKLDAKAIDKALKLLHGYVADPHATKKPEAEQLLADCDVATSEPAAVNTLVAMSDEQFARFKNSGKLDDRVVTYPALLEIRAATLRRNLETANQRREENKITANRRREENKIAEANRQAAERAAAAAATDEYIKQQIRELEAGRKEFEMRFAGWSPRREQAVDNLKALGPAALPAVPTLILITLNDEMWGVKRRAIELLGEIGGLRGMLAIGRALEKYGYDSEVIEFAEATPPDWRGRNLRSYQNEVVKAAEDALAKMLPAVCRELTMDDAIFLFDLHRLGSKRVSPAIERAWAASGLNTDAVVKEINRRTLAEANARSRRALAAQAIADAKEIAAVGKLRAFGEKLLPPRIKLETPETIKVAEDELLKLLPALGSDLTMDGAIFLVDLHRSGNKRVSPAIERAWAASKVIQTSITQLRGVGVRNVPGAAGQTDYIIRAMNHISNNDNYVFTRAGDLKRWPKEAYQIANEAHPNNPVIRGPSGNLMSANWNANQERTAGDGGKTVRGNAEAERWKDNA